PEIPKIYPSFLSVGETSGNMAEVIRRYVNYLKLADSIRQKAINALIYPLILLTVVIAVVIFLLTYVVPSFAEIYTNNSSELPFATVILIKIATFLRNNIALAGVAVICLAAVSKILLKTSANKIRLWKLMLAVPLLKDILNRYFTAQAAKTFALVLESGMPLVPALYVVSDSVANPVLEQKLKKAAVKIKEGSGIAGAFASVGVMDALSLQMVHVGESTGSLEEMLMAISDLYDEESAQLISRTLVFIEPLLMLIMGAVVGAIVIIMYLPIFYLGNSIG
ncbi:type II secretion system F family protein, partial [bacterium]